MSDQDGYKGRRDGIISSRRIAEACQRNVVFMALSADARPHFTTIAAFVSSLEHEIASLFGGRRERIGEPARFW
jgi:hypothetical protein